MAQGQKDSQQGQIPQEERQQEQKPEAAAPIENGATQGALATQDPLAFAHFLSDWNRLQSLKGLDDQVRARTRHRVRLKSWHIEHSGLQRCTVLAVNELDIVGTSHP